MNATSKNWTRIRALAACFTASLLLAACNDDRKDASSPSSSTGDSTSVGGSVTPTDASKSGSQGNTAPVISGSPSSTAKVGVAYNFQPSASDADGQGLGFSIANKPAWATFDTSTGLLKGTPTASHVGTQANIVISVSDGSAQALLASFSITVQAAGTTSGASASAPTISGQAVTAVKAGTAYSFQPSASDPNGDKLTFSVSGKPSWANFDTSTGKLSGTPAIADIGTNSNITISVSDGASTVSLAPFSVLVSASTTGSATLSWTPPTANTDGTPVTNLGGYRIYYGTNANSLGNQIQVSNAGLTSYTVGNLAPGTYYFAVAAYTADGIEGAASAVGSKTIM